MKSTALKYSLFSFLTFILMGSASGGGVVTSATEANFRAALAGGGTVTFAVSGTITFASTIVITNHTVIDAAGQNITLSGGGNIRVLQADPGVSLTLKNLNIANGLDSANVLGCGGVLSQGELTVVGCTFSNNVAIAAVDATGALRQWNTSSYLTVVDSTFVNNRGNGSAGAIDTGLSSFTYGIRLTNCTFMQNSAAVGAVLVREPILQPSWMVNCTVAWNTNQFDASVKQVPGFTTTARLKVINTIVAHPVGGNSGMGFVDAGHNLSSDSSAVFTNVTTRININPMLGPLADNGGVTWTMALLANSPALDTADPIAAFSADQRGISRPLGVGVDIGAFEGTQGVAGTNLVLFSVDDFSVGESGGAGAVRIVRIGPSSGASSVSLTATSGTATAGADFGATNIVISFAAGEVEKTVYLDVMDDNHAEGNETVALSLSNLNGAILGTPGAAVLTILDDESPQALTSCTYASLATAISNGGWYVFNCDATITFPATLTVASNTVLDAAGHNVVFDGAGSVRLFNVPSGVALTLNHLTLTRGRYESPYNPAGDGFEGVGGALSVTGGTLNLAHCKFWTNSAVGGMGRSVSSFGSPGNGGAGRGGAIYLNGGTLNAIGSDFIGNIVTGGQGGSASQCSAAVGTGGLAGGGAIANSNGILKIEGCNFTFNVARGGFAPFCVALHSGDTVGESFGGALFNGGGSAEILDCRFDQNGSTAATNINAMARNAGRSWGGAIQHAAGVMKITQSQFFANYARGGNSSFYSSPSATLLGVAGGGALRSLSALEIVGCTFNANQSIGGTATLQVANPNPVAGAPAAGGALQIEGTCMITNSTLVGNFSKGGLAAVSRGGAVFVSGAMSSIVNVTLSGNDATAGGNLCQTNSVIQMANTIVANSRSGSNNLGSIIDWGHNLSSDSSCGFSGQGSLNSMDPKLGPLDNYGGPTLTTPLLTGSPAIDGGDNAACPPTDQRGRTRPFGPVCDIGAFESSPPYVIAGRITGRSLTNTIFITKGNETVIATNGLFRFDGNPMGAQTLTASNGNYVFVPNGYNVTLGPDVIGLDFIACHWNTVNIVDRSNGLVQVVYAGTNGQTHRLLVSSDAVTWFGLVTNTIGPSNYFQATDFGAVGQVMRLYRTEQTQ